MCRVDYAEAREGFFAPRAPDAPPPALPNRSPARQLRDAIEPLATICWWSEPAYDVYAALGLDFLTGYVWSRASVLGEPDPGVVAAAFGVFEPGAIVGLLQAARDACSLEQIRRARLEGAVAALRPVLGEQPETTGVITSIKRGLEAARPLGRPFFAGLAGLPWPEDELGQLWHACAMLREYRGDGHLAACVSVGLDGIEANILTELWVGWTLSEYTGTRAWAPEAMEAAADRLRARGLLDGETLSDKGRAFRAGLEDTTDAAVQTVIDAIGDDLKGVIHQTDAWSQAIVQRGWFPPDPYKRASG
ncbi:MAG: hypothetical protein NVS3B1_28430 [Marmoricola sp.]